VWFDQNPDSGNEYLIQYVVSQVHCSHCGSQYHPDDVHILDHVHDMWTLVVRCPQCHAHALVMAVLQGDMPSLILHQEEADEDYDYQDDLFEGQHPSTLLPETQPITDEDVAAWHDFLANFHGDMHDLLACL
jgi:DNA-directed RNA polymerase subunit RPC12/RpoP